MERLNRLRQIAEEFDRLGRELPGLSDAERDALIEQTLRLTREMTCLLNERRRDLKRLYHTGRQGFCAPTLPPISQEK